MPGQCTSALKAARAHEAQTVARRMHAEFLQSCVGQSLPVLFETGEGEGSVGHSDTYVLVRVPEEGLRGTLRSVRITGTDGEELRGELAESN